MKIFSYRRESSEKFMVRQIIFQSHQLKGKLKMKNSLKIHKKYFRHKVFFDTTKRNAREFAYEKFSFSIRKMKNETRKFMSCPGFSVSGLSVGWARKNKKKTEIHII